MVRATGSLRRTGRKRDAESEIVSLSEEEFGLVATHAENLNGDGDFAWAFEDSTGGAESAPCALG
jgi:hypothetical protein